MTGPIRSPILVGVVGVSVVARDGVNVGAIDGAVDDFSEGSEEGIVDGKAEGISDTCSVGATDGYLDGTVVLSTVLIYVIPALGETVGGECVGAKL